MNRAFLPEFAQAALRLVAKGETLRFQLAWQALWAARHQGGSCRFPFGTYRYADALVLYFQYYELFRGRCYDFEVTRAQPVIVDCGGNIGMSVARFKQLAPGAQITVYEADPQVAALLAGNVNACGFQDVTVRQVAVAARWGKLRFKADGLDGGSLQGSGEENTIEVPAVRLAEVLPETVDLLKLDIEGAEFEVIPDLIRSGASNRIQRIVAELHPSSRYPAQTAQLLSLLGDAGFQVAIGNARSAPDLSGSPQLTPFAALPDGRHLLHLYAWKPTAGTSTAKKAT